MSSIQVILVVTQLEFGGAQSAAIKLCDKLNKRGVEARVIFLYKKSTAFENYQHLYQCIYSSAPTNPIHYIKILFNFFTLIRKTKPGSVISFTHYANVLSQPICWFCGVKRRIASQRNPASSFPRIARLLDYCWGLIGIYTNIVMVSKAVLKSFENYPKSYNRQVEVIPNGVDKLPVFQSSDQLRTFFNLPKDKFCMLTIGRLAPQKNQAFLLEVTSKIPGSCLIIVGNGELKAELHRMAKSSDQEIIFIDHLSEQEIPQILSCCDLFLFPSLFEGMSNALIEAMMYEIPIIASNIDPNKEVLGAEFNEVLLDPKDQTAWEKSIVKVMKEKELRVKLVNLAKLRSKEFRLEYVTDSFENLVNL